MTSTQRRGRKKKIGEQKDSAGGMVHTAITGQAFPTQNTQPDEPEIEDSNDN